MIATTQGTLEPAPLPAAPRTRCPRCGARSWSRFGTRWLCHECWRTGTNVTPDMQPPQARTSGCLPLGILDESPRRRDA
jgi:hypothetical protein